MTHNPRENSAIFVHTYSKPALSTYPSYLKPDDIYGLCHVCISIVIFSIVVTLTVPMECATGIPIFLRVGSPNRLLSQWKRCDPKWYRLCPGTTKHNGAPTVRMISMKYYGIPAWISNYTHNKMWDEITYPLPKLRFMWWPVAWQLQVITRTNTDLPSSSLKSIQG